MLQAGSDAIGGELGMDSEQKGGQYWIGNFVPRQVADSFCTVDPAIAAVLPLLPVRAAIAEQTGDGPSGPEPAHISDYDLARHTYVYGDVGTGKSRLLFRLVAEQLNAGHSVVAVDPHWRTIEALVGEAERADIDPDQIRVIRPSDPPEDAPGWTPLQGDDPLAAADRLFDELMAADSEALPLVRRVMRMGLRFAAYRKMGLPSFIEFLEDKDLRDRIVALSDPPDLKGVNEYRQAAEFWRGRFAKLPASKQEEEAGYILGRAIHAAATPYFRALFGARENTFDVAPLWKRQGIALIHLDRSKAGGQDGARFFTGLLAHRLLAAAMEATGGVKVCLVLDEMASADPLTADAISKIILMARQTGLRLIVAGQMEGKYPEGLRTSLKTATVRFYFRLDHEDAERFSRSLKAATPVASRPEWGIAAGEPVPAPFPLLRSDGTHLPVSEDPASYAGDTLFVNPYGDERRETAAEFMERWAAPYQGYLTRRWPDGWRVVLTVPEPLVLPTEGKLSARPQRDWASIIQDLPERHAVLHIKGRVPRVLRVADTEVVPATASYMADVYAAQRPKRTSEPGPEGEEGGASDAEYASPGDDSVD
jgi:hypothetical protein